MSALFLLEACSYKLEKCNVNCVVEIARCTATSSLLFFSNRTQAGIFFSQHPLQHGFGQRVWVNKQGIPFLSRALKCRCAPALSPFPLLRWCKDVKQPFWTQRWTSHVDNDRAASPAWDSFPQASVLFKPLYWGGSQFQQLGQYSD